MSTSSTPLIDILTGKFGLPESEIRNGATFDDLGFDSLALIELSLTIEKQLGIRLEEGELQPTQTAQEAADLLDAALQRASR